MTRVSDRFVSYGHAGRFDAVIWVNEPAHVAWEAGGVMPDDAMLVEEVLERTGDGDRAAGLLVMDKHSGTWRFLAIGADGEVVSDERTAACEACHRDAPRDNVFFLSKR